MNKLTVCLSVAVILFLTGCALGPSGPPLHEQVDTQLDVGQEWTVDWRFWPGRIDNPYARHDTTVRRTLRYKVTEAPANNDPGKIRVRGPNGIYLLNWSPQMNLLSVQQVLDRRPGGILKVKHRRRGKLGYSALFYRELDKHLPVGWYHPSMTVTDRMTRLPFLKGGEFTGEWVRHIVQSKSDNRFLIELNDSISNTKVEFLWEAGKPWWDRMKWVRNQRIIAVGQTSFSSL